MHRQLITKLLNEYSPEDLVEQEAKMKMLDFISREPDCFERSCQEGHFTGSCWLENFKGNAALLTHHKKFNDWLQLGGHADGDNDLLRVAQKEAREESGLSVEPVLDKIFDIGVHGSSPEEGTTRHYDVRFYLRAIENKPFVVSEESYNLKWVKQENELPNNIDVKRMFKKWEKLKKNNRTWRKKSYRFPA
jgi:8-oxo-dGTP pyrophosphatase MutT (NUDIX family)